MSSKNPLKLVRIVVYALTLTLAIIAGSAGINALVKANNEENDLIATGRSLGVNVFISVQDLRSSGIVLTVAMLFLGFTSLYALLTVLFLSSGGVGLPIMFTFMSIWIFANAVPVTLFSAQRSAKVLAFFQGSGIPVPDSLVQTTEQQLGFSRVYWDHSYVRFFAVVIWPTFLLCLISTALAFVVWTRHESRSAEAAAEPGLTTDAERQSSVEKPETIQPDGSVH